MEILCLYIHYTIEKSNILEMRYISVSSLVIFQMTNVKCAARGHTRGNPLRTNDDDLISSDSLMEESP